MRYTARGAGGLSNAIPEILKDAGFGGKCELRRIESADLGMSPLQIWCNEVSLPLPAFLGPFHSDARTLFLRMSNF